MVCFATVTADIVVMNGEHMAIYQELYGHRDIVSMMRMDHDIRSITVIGHRDLRYIGDRGHIWGIVSLQRGL